MRPGRSLAGDSAGELVNNFRSTVLTSKPRTGRRAVVNGRPASAAVIGSRVLTAEAALRPSSPAGKRCIGGKDHIIREGGSLVAHRDHADSSSTSDHAASAISPRGRPLAKAPAGSGAPGGGEDHIRLGDDATVYTCSLKEAEAQLTLNPAVRESAARLPNAGTRPAVRPRTSAMTVGGDDHVSAMWGAAAAAGGGAGGPHEYRESLAEAQARLALDPAARAEAARSVVAGRRVEPKWLGGSLRTSQPVGGRTSLTLQWTGEGGAASASAGNGVSTPAGAGSAADGGSASGAGLASSIRILRPEHPVGGRSGAIISSAAPAFRAASRGGRGVQDSTGVFGSLSWGDDSLRPSTAPTPDSGGAGVFSPRSMAARREREQPLGGRSTLSVGMTLESVGATRAGAGGASTSSASSLSHMRSSIVL